MTPNYELLGLLIAILGQYVLLFALYRDMQIVQTEFSLCKYHRSIAQVGDALRNGEKIWKDDLNDV